MKRFFITISGICMLFYTATSQVKQDIENYIAKYKDIALEEMVRCKIPASITLAQGVHESSWGKSKLATEANNHFGIKCKDEWDGKKFYQNDDAPNECFRVYDRAEDSYADHSDFLITRPRYAELFDLPITDYKGWAHGLKATGYATNPKYADILIKTIEDYNLTQYDQIGLAMMSKQEKQLNPDNSPVAMPTASNSKQEAIPVEVITAPTATTQPAPEVKRNAFTKASSVAFVTVRDDNTKKEFSVNGCKAVRAEGTTDPLAIAYNYQIQYTQVLAFNDMNEGDKFKDGQNIFLQNKRARGSEEKYVVEKGESMYDISQKTGVKLKDLYQKNLMALNDQPVAGESIYLQEKRTTAPKTMSYSDFLKSKNTAGNNAVNTSTANTSAENTVPVPSKRSYIEQPAQYKVEPSDTLYSIAKKFNTTVQQLRALNNLDGTDLHPGQTLVVSR